jgi:MFS family permease
MVTGIVGRSIWIGLAVIPWVLPRHWWPAALVTGTAGAMLLLNLGGPAWMNWAADLIPAPVRGRYMSRRIRLGQGIGLITTLLIGFGLDRSSSLAPDDLRNAISVAYIVAAAFGVIDFLWHMPVRLADPPRRERKSMRRLLSEPLADRNFRWFLGFTAMMTFAVGYVGQFANLYVIEFIAIDSSSRYLLINTMMVAIPLLVMMLTLPIWGRLMDRFGRRPVMLIAGVLIAHGGASWIFVTPHNWWFGYITVIIATAAWPAIEVGNFNIMLSLADSKEGTRSGTAYVAVNSVVVAIAGTLSGLFAGSLAEMIGPQWRGSIFGFPLTYHGVLLIISGGLRLVALLFLAKVEEPGSARTRDAARYLIGGLYSNVQQAVFAPSRMVGVFGKLSRMSWVFAKRTARSVVRTPQDD